MMLSEDVNNWGIPVKPVPAKKKPAVEAVEEDPCTILEDLDLTLRFLSEVVEKDLTPDEQKEKLLREARLARDEFKSKRESFCKGMEALGVSRNESNVIWADADT